MTNSDVQTHSPTFASRLPQVGTTIFTRMSQLAADCQAINLGQGFPDFDADPRLLQAVHDAMLAGHNQYAPMAGVTALRQTLAEKIQACYGRKYDPEHEITVTAGATQALFTAIACCCGPGDEVIVLEPCYDSYLPSIELSGARAVRVPLRAGSFEPDLDRIAAAINSKTRALIINSPHNPSGTIWSAQDMQKLADLLAPTHVILISDEVYEHIVFKPHRHESVCRYPQLAGRAFVVSSFGKTFHVTGWKMGYIVAPAAMMREFRKVHQFNVFAANTPFQYGLDAYLKQADHYLYLADFYQKKRDIFRHGIQHTPLTLLPCEGTFFQSVSYASMTTPERHLSEADFCQWLTREMGVAAIPLSAFYADGFDQKTIRFCFAKKKTTLLTALERLKTL